MQIREFVHTTISNSFTQYIQLFCYFNILLNNPFRFYTILHKTNDSRIKIQSIESMI